LAILHISDARIIFGGRAAAGVFGDAADSARKFIEIDSAPRVRSHRACSFHSHCKSDLFRFAAEATQKGTEKRHESPTRFSGTFKERGKVEDPQGLDLPGPGVPQPARGCGFHDFTQPPVFPPVLLDSERATLDLADCAVDRDLARPGPTE
jgi:hypothetical protein